MTLRKIAWVVGGLVVVLGAVLGLKAAQILSLIGFAGEMEAAGYPPVPVATRAAERAEWEETLRFTGSLKPVQGVTLTAEVPGTVSAIHVENGARVAEGQPLIDLDAREEKAELESARARLRLAALNLDRTRGLLEKRILAQSEFDAAQATYDEAAATVENLLAMIAKKSIVAPFAGQAGIRLVNLGQTVAPGDRLLPLHSSDPIFVEFAVPQTRLGRIAVGNTLRVTSDGLDEPVTGGVTVINPMVDEASRTARVQGVLQNTDGALRPGQFVVVDVVLPGRREVVAIPSSAVVAASYGDSVFVVEEQEGKMVARQQFVRTGGQRGDFVAIEKGLDPGDRVVSAGAFKLSNGAVVAPNDAMQPEPSLNPAPETQ
jgi:membrane fusion protein, multidrug efflux system